MNEPPLIVRGDIDGFFGLFVDNLLQLMLIKLLCEGVLHFPDELVSGTILPGAAVSILAGNLFYAWQARRLMRQTGRTDVTALPYGINTPSLFVYVFFVMAPVYYETLGDRPDDPQRQQLASTLAWQAGLLACFGSALIEIAGAFVGDRLRRHTPRAALLAALAGIAITFISMTFVFQVFDNPGLALLPLAVVLICYASATQTSVPAGLVAVLTGMALAQVWDWAGMPLFQPPMQTLELALRAPRFVPLDLLDALQRPELATRFLAVILPMGLFNVIGSLQNLESAEAAGDRFPTRSSLLANGLGSLVASLCGSCFPTTIYIGHPGWKSMGARAGYSTLNGLAITALGLTGGVGLFVHFVPLEATLGILIWIGIIITAQAFSAVPRQHALAVAIGLIPALGAWALHLIQEALRAAGTNLFLVAPAFGSNRGETFIHGAIALNQGYILTSLLFAAMTVHLIERRFRRAGLWALAASALSALGLIHAFDWTPQGITDRFARLTLNPFRFEPAAPTFALMYLVIALMLLTLPDGPPRPPEDESVGHA